MDNDNIATAIEAGKQLAGVSLRVLNIAAPNNPPVPVALIEEEGNQKIVVLTDAIQAMDDRATGPRDRRGIVTLTELESLIAYVNRYKSENAIAWADAAAFGIAVVFDDHPAGPERTSAAWRTHRANYTCPKSPEWIAWTQLDGQPMPQEKFADFIEARLEDLRAADGYPKPTEMLQVARNLMIRTKGTFERSINPTTGDSVLTNKTETETGSTQIPRAFVIGVPVFDGGTPYQVEARVRMAIVDGRAAFSYTLHRRKEIERDAFADVRNRLVEQTSIVLLAGKP